MLTSKELPKHITLPIKTTTCKKDRLWEKDTPENTEREISLGKKDRPLKEEEVNMRILESTEKEISLGMKNKFLERIGKMKEERKQPDLQEKPNKLKLKELSKKKLLLLKEEKKQSKRELTESQKRKETLRSENNWPEKKWKRRGTENLSYLVAVIISKEIL